MKKIIKKLFLIAISCTLFVLNFNVKNVNANGETYTIIRQEKFNDASGNELIRDTIQWKDPVTNSTYLIKLYREYTNIIPILEELKGEEIVNLVKNQYNLNELTASNAEYYLDSILNIKNSLKVKDITAKLEFVSYKAKNIAIKDIISNLSKHTQYSKETVKLYKDLYFLLPSLEENDNISDIFRRKWDAEINLRAGRIFNIEVGSEYARQYAEKPNSNFYLHDDDCANFASQILYMGGIKEVRGSYFGIYNWWFNWSFNHEGTHTWYNPVNSRTWARVDDLAKKFGIQNVQTWFSTFTSVVQTGDFILFSVDKDDEKWRHIGYVYQKNGDKRQYKTTKTGVVKSYYDLLVAQHTSNYFSWASTDTNNWDEEEPGTPYYKTRYAILRRQ